MMTVAAAEPSAEKTSAIRALNHVRNYGDVAPNVVVEVKTPNDSLSQSLETVNLSLESGAKLVWLVNPETETIATVSQNAVSRFKVEETISAEPILKTFRKTTSDFFR